MFRAFSLGVLGLGMILATFSHSTNYGLQNYSIGPGATDTTHSTTYYAQGTVGEQANGKSSGSTKTANNGSVQTEQLNIPPAPTLSNGSNTYYNMLGLIIATGGNPTDTTYAVAISTNNFTTTNYVQANGTIGGSAVYQTYTAWGGASGSDIIDLSPSTSYEVKVAAKEGQFTNTEYGAYASASTVSPSTTFSITPNSLTLSSLLPGSVITSSAMSIGFATNADSGGAVYVSGARP
jgi:hypothetical protein